MMGNTFTEKFIIRNIKKLDKNTSNSIYEVLTLVDTKEFIEEVIGEAKTPFERIMMFFDSQIPIAELEQRTVTKVIFEKLKWGNDRCDVMNSFWTTYKSGLVISSNHEHYYFKDNHANIGNDKAKYAKKYLGKANYNTQELQKYANEVRNLYEYDKLASRCHCIANFMPCPPRYPKSEKTYNQLKGMLPDVRDYLPLMIDKIQQCIDNKQSLKCYDFVKKKEYEVFLDVVKEWRQWFVDNRNKYLLEDYYVINGSEEKIVGIRLFKKQSLLYPIPKTSDELKECLNEIFRRIEVRALRMAKSLN
ncbi:MAG: hypothetical protein LRZ93_04705 [Clostridiales bacterium]|nr:hypothetical protein [Clostridiales bacterium]